MMADERDIINVTPITTEQAWQYPSLYRTVQHDFSFLAEDMQLRIVALVTGVCRECRDAGRDCLCWVVNDG